MTYEVRLREEADLDLTEAARGRVIAPARAIPHPLDCLTLCQQPVGRTLPWELYWGLSASSCSAYYRHVHRLSGFPMKAVAAASAIRGATNGRSVIHAILGFKFVARLPLDQSRGS